MEDENSLTTFGVVGLEKPRLYGLRLGAGMAGMILPLLLYLLVAEMDWGREAFSLQVYNDVCLRTRLFKDKPVGPIDEADLQEFVSSIIEADELSTTQKRMPFGYERFMLDRYPSTAEEFDTLSIIKALTFRHRRVSELGLLHTPYDDHKLQGLYGEPVTLHVIKPDGIRTAYVHLWGANGINELDKLQAGRSDHDDVLVGASNQDWVHYYKAALEANRQQVNHLFLMSSPLVLLAALFIYFVLLTDREVGHHLVSIPTWHRLILSVSLFEGVLLSVAYVYTVKTYGVANVLEIVAYKLLFTLIINAVALFWLWRRGRKVRIAGKKMSRSQCPGCNYNLSQSIQSPKFSCPECGLAFQQPEAGLVWKGTIKTLGSE